MRSSIVILTGNAIDREEARNEYQREKATSNSVTSDGAWVAGRWRSSLTDHGRGSDALPTQGV